MKERMKEGRNERTKKTKKKQIFMNTKTNYNLRYMLLKGKERQ